MSWSDIQRRIEECRSAPDSIRCLENLFRETSDGMVALAIGEEYEKSGQSSEACQYYERAEQLFPREEWKTKAREAKAGVSGIPGKTNARLSNTLFVVSCTKPKIWNTNPDERRKFVPAQEAYTGPTFTRWMGNPLSRRVNWVVLSAKYGFIEPDHPISNYDVTFSKPETGPISCESLSGQVRFQPRLGNRLLSSFERVVVWGSETYLTKVKCAFTSTRATILSWEQYRTSSGGEDH